MQPAPAAAGRSRGPQSVPCGQSHSTFPDLVLCESDGAVQGKRAAAAAAAVGETPTSGRRGGRAARSPEETGVDHRAEERCGARPGPGTGLGVRDRSWASRGRPLGGARCAIQFFRWDGLSRELPFTHLWAPPVTSGCLMQIVEHS